jgi:adenylate kinase family enzyme
MRYLVVGTSGAGKSTFAGKLAAATRCPHIELDSHYWGPDWKAVPPEQFKRSVAEATRGTCWVADGNYSAVRGVLWSRATHVVWLNYGRFTVFSRLLWRTLSRGIARTRLSHGNRESLRMAFFSRNSILLWSLSTYAKNQAKFASLRGGDEFAWVTSHVFRKTAATILDEAGLSARRVADQLGHARPSMTQDTYMGRKTVDRRAADALEGALGEPKDDQAEDDEVE